MAKNKIEKTNEKEMRSLKEYLMQLEIGDDDFILIHRYGKADDDMLIQRSSLDRKTLSSKVKLIHPHQGGKEYDYSLYKFILH